MKDMKTTEVEIVKKEVGGQWACLVTCIGGCTAAGLVVPGGVAVSAFATVGSAL